MPCWDHLPTGRGVSPQLHLGSAEATFQSPLPNGNSLDRAGPKSERYALARRTLLYKIITLE